MDHYYEEYYKFKGSKLIKKAYLEESVELVGDEPVASVYYYVNGKRTTEQEYKSYVKQLTKGDKAKAFSKGKASCRIERCILGTGEKFGDGSHILYVNGAYRDDTPIGKLMHDFSCTDPADMHYGVLADRLRFFKESKEGIAIMCKAMEDMRNESLREGIKQGTEDMAVRMLEAGKYALEEIADISGLSLDELKRLDAERVS